jgi:Aspartyl protease
VTTGPRKPLLHQVLEESRRKGSARIDAEVALALVYLQTKRYERAGELFSGLEGTVNLPVWELMKSFGEERPYQLDWGGESEPALPFTQKTAWELPCIRLEVDGLEVAARIDTGGELLTLSPDVAEAVGLHAVAAAEGDFAGGARAEVRYGRVGSVRLGALTVDAVPVAVVSLDRPVIGTGFLHQFLATIDYPGRRSCSARGPRKATRSGLRSRSRSPLPISSSRADRSSRWSR